MTVKATVERQFMYRAIGKEPQLISRVEARMEFPQAVELDDEVMLQVEKFYIDSASVADYDHEHDGMQTVIQYALGVNVIITYEVI